MNKRIIVFIGVGICLVIVISLALLSNRRGTLEVSLAPTSELKESVVMTLSFEKYKKTHTLPYKQRVNPGRYTITVWGTGSDTFQEEMEIKSRQTTTIQVSLKRQGTNQSEVVPEYYQLFPYYDGNYDIQAKFGEEAGNTTLIKLIITPYIVPMVEDSDKDLQTQKETYVAEARLWLKNHNVPESIPIEVNSPY